MHFVIHALFDAKNNNNNNKNSKAQKKKKKKRKLRALESLVTFPTPFKAQLKVVSLRPTLFVKMDLFIIILQKLQKCFSS